VKFGPAKIPDNLLRAEWRYTWTPKPFPVHDLYHHIYNVSIVNSQ